MTSATQRPGGVGARDVQRLFGGHLHARHFGTEVGDFSPRADDSVEKMEAVRRKLELSAIVDVAAAFTNRITTAEDLEQVGEGVYQTACGADGCLVERTGVGIGVTNGDCAIGVLYEPGSRRAVVMHLGLHCIWRPEGDAPLLERAVSAVDAAPQDLQMWVGLGAGPCCYGHTHDTPFRRRRAAEIIQTFGKDVLPHPVEYGPRKGAQGYDHVLMATRQAAELGVGHLEVDSTCTSCTGLDDPDAEGYGAYYSNIRDIHRRGERNLALVTLVG